MHPPKVLGLPSTEMIRLIKPLYGIADAGDYWLTKLRDHLTTNLSMDQSFPDPALFLKKTDGNLIGLTGTYVDDTLHTGYQFFLKL